MLQLRRLHDRIIEGYRRAGAFPPRWSTMAELEQVTDDWIARLRADRRRESRTPGLALRALVDRLLRTDRVEYFDRDDLGEAAKVGLARELHLVNRVLRAYPSFLDALRPHLEEVHRREGRRARLLELASGSGEFSLALAALARDRGLPVDVTGSDIVPRYAVEGAAHARARGLDVRFIELNAFDMGSLEAGAYDVVFIAQSAHHFSPGQIAKMIAQARRVGPTAFVLVDGYRSLTVLLGANLVGLMPLRKGPRLAYRMWHDAVTSARKFLPAAELEVIARIAAPDDAVRVSRRLPYHTVLEVTPPRP